jgi:hypothetical protein
MFRIDWIDLALSNLADGWLSADSRLRADITSAAEEIERRLQRAPDIVGEGREPGTRVLIVNPLTVNYHVNVRTKTVLISGVRVSQRRPRSDG